MGRGLDDMSDLPSGMLSCSPTGSSLQGALGFALEVSHCMGNNRESSAILITQSEFREATGFAVHQMGL